MKYTKEELINQDLYIKCDTQGEFIIIKEFYGIDEIQWFGDDMVHPYIHVASKACFNTIEGVNPDKVISYIMAISDGNAGVLASSDDVSGLIFLQAITDMENQPNQYGVGLIT